MLIVIWGECAVLLYRDASGAAAHAVVPGTHLTPATRTATPLESARFGDRAIVYLARIVTVASAGFMDTRFKSL
jgi:hypothetical protein